MPTLQEVQEQVKRARSDDKTLAKWVVGREINELPKILGPNERVDAVIQGRYRAGMGILVATNKRLLFVEKRLFRNRTEDFQYDRLTSISHDEGLAWSTIRLLSPGNSSKIDRIVKGTDKAFVSLVRGRIGRSAAVMTQAPADIAGQLEKLARLKTQGILTEAEFDAQKRKLLR